MDTQYTQNLRSVTTRAKEGDMLILFIFFALSRCRQWYTGEGTEERGEGASERAERDEALLTIEGLSRGREQAAGSRQLSDSGPRAEGEEERRQGKCSRARISSSCSDNFP